MRRLKAILVDDVPENIETLSHYLDKSEYSPEIVGTATTLEDAGSLIRSKEFDIAFLDIQIKNDTIFQLLEELDNEGKIDFDIVFVTAHSSFEYATKAIQYACLDYVTKPILEKDIQAALHKSAVRHQVPDQSEQFKLLFDILRTNQESPKSISVSLPKGIIEVIQLSNISHIEADGNTSYFHFINGKKLHAIKSLAHYSSILEMHEDFLLISRQCLVHLSHVKRYDHRSKSLTLSSGKTLVVSHRYSVALRQHLLRDPKDKSLLKSTFDLFKKFLGPN